LLRVVIDTNVFVSGILTETGNPSIALKAWKRTRKYQLFISEEIIEEVLKVMHRLEVPKDVINDWDKTIRKNAVIVFPAKKIRAVKNDPSDDKFLECAAQAKADYIVTGDKHLKKLSRFEEIKIINSKNFLDILFKYKE